MGLIDGFVLLGLFLVGLPLAALVGTLLGKLFGIPRLGGCLPGLVLFTIVFGVPVALALTGVPTVASVEAKQERVRVVGYTGHWYHSYRLVLHYKPPNVASADFTTRSPVSDSVTLNVSATRDAFDRARVGSKVAVVYLPYRPSIGRLADRSFVDLLSEIYALPDVRIGLLMMLAIGLAVWISARTPNFRLRYPVLKAVRVGIFTVCFLTAMTGMWLGFQNPSPVPESAVNDSADARVVTWRRIDITLFSLSNSNHSSSPLAQPFDVVELEFTPTALGQLVHAADAVDSGSVRGLEQGDVLRIRYDAGAPRTIRIQGGTRTYRAKNARDIGEQILFSMAVLLALFGISMWWARRKRTAP